MATTPVRNPDNVVIAVDAAVYASASVTQPAIPATVDTALGVAWELPVGILDGKDGFSNDRKWKDASHFGWGIGLIKRTYSQFEWTRSFTALEDNPSTRAMLLPGSTDTNIVIPRPARLWMCFERQLDTGGVERLFTKRKATVWCEKYKSTEDDITSLPFQCTLYADATGSFFQRQISAVAP